MQTKLSILKAHLNSNDLIAALRIAAKFPNLGDDKKVITMAWAAFINPSFYTQIGKNPDELLELGIQALKARYS
jgi:hypothetical protein